MARKGTSFVCQNCGAVTGKWAGRCESCGEWNTIVEEREGAGVGGSPNAISRRRGRVVPLVGLDGESEAPPRMVTRVGELDRVTGGGFVRGSALLVGGDPGIGKSTLLIQAAARIARLGHRAVYISGEEAIDQVRLRAHRLGLTDAPVGLAAETSVEDILATLSAGPAPDFVIIDSIQTLWTEMKDDGLVVVGVPCNQFGSQEPGKSEEIQSFCRINYGVDFPLLEKQNVNGKDRSPLYEYLLDSFKTPVAWNFEKVLVGRDGKVIDRYRSATGPDSDKLTAAIKKALAS